MSFWLILSEIWSGKRWIYISQAEKAIKKTIVKEYLTGNGRESDSKYKARGTEIEIGKVNFQRRKKRTAT